MGSLDLGFQTNTKIKQKLIKETKTIYNLGCDTLEVDQGTFVIYQGSHGDKGAGSADLIFSACYLEEDGIFVNMEGKNAICKKSNSASRKS